jgi:hypothetical protein
MTEPTNIILNTLTLSNATGAPTTGTVGGTGTKLILSTGSSTGTPFALGSNTNMMWYGVPSGASHVFYGGNSGTQELLRIGPTSIIQPLKPVVLVYGNQGGAVSTSYGNSITIPFNLVLFDTRSGYNTTTYTYTIPETGYYYFYIQAYKTDVGVDSELGIAVNGNLYCISRSPDTTAYENIPTCVTRFFNKGDTVVPRLLGGRIQANTLYVSYMHGFML